MYIVTATGQSFESFIAAVAAGKAAGSEVVQADNGVRRWAPAAPVTSKQIRRYNERAAAYAAQQRANRK